MLLVERLRKCRVQSIPHKLGALFAALGPSSRVIGGTTMRSHTCKASQALPQKRSDLIVVHSVSHSVQCSTGLLRVRWAGWSRARRMGVEFLEIGSWAELIAYKEKT